MNTSLRILKALQKRNKTLSELSRELNLTKPSVHYHLSKLTAKGLIKRIHNGNKFIYYTLTEKGKRILEIVLSALASLPPSYALAHLATTQQPQRLTSPQIAGIGEITKTTATDFYTAFILAYILIFVIVYFTLSLFKTKYGCSAEKKV